MSDQMPVFCGIWPEKIARILSRYTPIALTASNFDAFLADTQGRVLDGNGYLSKL